MFVWSQPAERFAIAASWITAIVSTLVFTMVCNFNVKAINPDFQLSTKCWFIHESALTLMALGVVVSAIVVIFNGAMYPLVYAYTSCRCRKHIDTIAS
jgi:hypothetical protein